MNLLAAITLWLATLTPGQRPYNHIFFVLLENVGYEAVVGDTVNAPYINNELLPQGVLYTKVLGLPTPVSLITWPSFLATPKASPLIRGANGRLRLCAHDRIYSKNGRRCLSTVNLGIERHEQRIEPLSQGWMREEPFL
jgi:hypothetical protein